MKLRITHITNSLPKLSVAVRILLYTASLILSAFTIVYVVRYDEITPAAAALFMLSGASVAFSVLYVVNDIGYIIKNIRLSDTFRKIRTNKRAERIITDYSYRTAATASVNFMLNSIYAAFNAVVGVQSGSSFYVSLAVYYFLLSVIRFFSIRTTLRHNHTKESQRYELLIYLVSGCMFILMSFVLVGIVAVTLSSDYKKEYPGMMIYAVATYTFIKLGFAIINTQKASRTQSPSTMTLRNLCLADSLVSLVSLQTALNSEFGGDAEFTAVINRAVGSIVCIVVFVIGVASAANAARGLKKLKDSEKSDVGA